MVVAVLVVMLVALTATTLVRVASGDVLRTRRSLAVLEARARAEAALDLFAARAAVDPAAVDPAGSGGGHPPLRTWARLDAEGRSVPCGPPADGCTMFDVRAVQVEAGDTERRVRAAVVEVVARAGCRRAQRCVDVRVQQRLERRSFLDFLVQTDYELMDPLLLPDGDGPGRAAWQREQCENDGSGRRLTVAERPPGCVAPAWFGSGRAAGPADEVDGPIHTNDDRIPHCGDPIFRGPVETTRGPADGPSATAQTTFASQEHAIAACGPPAKPSHEPRLAGAAVLRKAPAIGLPPDVSHLERAAAGGHGVRLPEPGAAVLSAADVTLQADGRVSILERRAGLADVCACDRPPPDSGVVYVDAPTVRVRGATPFPITIATPGTAVVDGDLGTTSDATAAAMVGVIAGGAVEIRMGDRLTGAVGDRALRGVALVSIAHTVVVDRWDDPTVCAPACPSLVMSGAIVGRYRPVIGSYDTVSGALAGGYRKALTHDERMRDTQPPYLLFDGQAPWRRVDEVETGAGTPGLISRAG